MHPLITKYRYETWLIDESKRLEIWEGMDRIEAGIKLDADTLNLFAQQNNAAQTAIVRGAVGIIPVRGTIAQDADEFRDASGGTSVEALDAAFNDMMGNESVGTILFVHNSGGGTLPLVPEFADKIMAARGQKRIVSHVNAFCGSADFWIAAAADEVVITPSGQIGSVGVFCQHVDDSAAMEESGVKITTIRFGEFKAEGLDEPLTEEAISHHQERVNAIGAQFHKFLSKARGVSVKTVASDFGRGRMVDAKQAVAVGMADRVATMEDTIARLTKPAGRRRGGSVANARRRLDAGV